MKEPMEPTPNIELVQINATGDAGVIAVAESLREADEIDYSDEETVSRT